MGFEFRLPDLAEGMTEAEVVQWKVGEGEKVALDQPLVEVMSDKATVEIPSPRAGVLAKINYREGEICKVGAVLFVIEESAQARASGNGRSVAHSHAVSAPPAAAAAALPTSASQASVAKSGSEPSLEARVERSRVLATPATRRLARRLEIDLLRVPASGPGGRITSEDVKRFAEGGVAVPDPKAATAMVPLRSGAHGFAPATGDEERIPFRGLRRRIAENMTRSAFTATHFTYVEEVDVTDLVAVRERVKARAAERGIKLTYLPFIVKAVVAGLKKWPSLNASLDEAAQEIVRKHYYHIGVAAQGPQGLMVTVVRNADARSIFDVAAEVERLGQAVQNGSARAEELTGSTFTISSLGKLGGLHATPIINFPEVGILGVHKIEQRAVVVEGAVVPRWRMNLSISLDHRLVDGWEGAMFLQEVKELLEDPTTMFMEMV
jgi:pyruvate dehydrogenase E2 component (dihydrolipoamide acetyltransferase)